MRPAPLFEAIMFFQLVSMSPPKGETIPRPVTTTRRIPDSLKDERPPGRGRGAVISCSARSSQAGGGSRGSGLVLIDIGDGVVDGSDLLGRVVGNLDAELFLEGHDQFDDVEAVRAEIVDEARFFGDLFGLDAKMLDDDFLHAIGGLAHILPFPRHCLRCPSRSLPGLASGWPLRNHNIAMPPLTCRVWPVT